MLECLCEMVKLEDGVHDTITIHFFKKQGSHFQFNPLKKKFCPWFMKTRGKYCFTELLLLIRFSQNIYEGQLNIICMFLLVDDCTVLGGLSKFSSDPVKVVNDAVDESTNMISSVFNFAASLIAPEEDEGNRRCLEQTLLCIMIKALSMCIY